MTRIHGIICTSSVGSPRLPGRDTALGYTLNCPNLLFVHYLHLLVLLTQQVDGQVV